MPPRLKKSDKLPLIIGVIPFLLAGIDSAQQKDVAMAVANFVMVTANLLALRFLADHALRTNVILFILNGFMALVMSWSLFLAGKKGLPYAWIVVACFYWGFSIVYYYRKKDMTPVDSTEKAGDPTQKKKEKPAKV